MTWELTGFERGGEALTHQINLDDALGRLLGLPAGERGPVPLSREAVATLGRIVELPLEEGREPFILEQRPPSGWILRGMGGDGPVDDDIDVDWVLQAVFARVLGEDLAYMQGPAFGDSFPLDRSRFTHIARLFGVDADFDEASWVLDQFANTPPRRLTPRRLRPNSGHVSAAARRLDAEHGRSQVVDTTKLGAHGDGGESEPCVDEKPLSHNGFSLIGTSNRCTMGRCWGS